jgi:hypothetical protein
VNSREMKVGAPVQAPGEGGNRKHPAIANLPNGQTLLVWTEGTGWKRGGSLAWQVFGQGGLPLAAAARSTGLPVWDFAAAIPHKNRFLVIA